MKKVFEVQVFSFDNLSDEARETVIERERFNVMDMVMEGHDREYTAAIQKLTEATGFGPGHWQVGYCDCQCGARLEKDVFHDIFYHFGEDQITGKLLFRYVNKYIMPNFCKGKWYGTRGWWDENKKYHYKYRHSRIIADYESCPLTGCCVECPFEDVLYKFYKTWNTYPDSYSLQDLMKDCWDAFFEGWYNEYQYWASDEGVEEELRNSFGYEDVMYYEDGSVCKMPSRYNEIA